MTTRYIKLGAVARKSRHFVNRKVARNGIVFNDGVAQMTGKLARDDHFYKFLKYFQNSYQAREVTLGELQNDADRPEGTVPAVPGDIPETGAPTESAPADGPAAATPATRTAKRKTSGDGLASAETLKVATVIRELAPSDGLSWLKDGRPSAEAVSTVCGEKVSQQLVDAAVPGYTRKEARGEAQLQGSKAKVVAAS